MPGNVHFRSVCVFVSIISGLSLIGCNDQEAEFATSPTTITVRAIQLERQSGFELTTTYYGRTEPVRRSDLSFEFPGRLDVVKIDEGDRVADGQLLARMDTTILKADRKVLLAKRGAETALLDRMRNGERTEVIAAAAASVKRLEAELERANAQKKRAEQVIERGAISETEYDRTISTYKAAFYALVEAEQRLDELKRGTRVEDIAAQESRVAAINAELEQLEIRFEKSVLHAPFDGICVARFRDEGVILSPGEPIVSLNEINKLQARFSIPKHHRKHVQSGGKLVVEGVAHEIRDVQEIAEIDSSTRTIGVVIPLTCDAASTPLPGSVCELHLVNNVDSECHKLPMSALVPSIRGLWSYYRLQPHEAVPDAYVVQKHDATVIHTDGDHVYVDSSLPDHSLVVADGVHKLVPGVLVHRSGSDQRSGSER